MAWCFVCLIEAVWIAVTAKKKMSTLSYVGEVPVALHIMTIAVLFAVLHILFEKIKNIRTEKMLLVLVTVLYAFTAVIQTPDVWFCTGMVLLLTFTFSYAFEPEACRVQDVDNDALWELFQKLEFTRLASRYQLHPPKPAEPEVCEGRCEPVIVETAEHAEAFLKQFAEKP